MFTLARNVFKYARKPKNLGYCTICEKKTIFIEKEDWLRDHYICGRCRSIPRNRALIKVIAELFPSFRTMAIHESSPSGPASAKLRRECSDYLPTYFFTDAEPGQIHRGYRCENLEKMTFADETFDLVVTQDVMEHVMNPGRAFAEIARTLRPGGAHVFTVPLYKGRKTLVRAYEENGTVHYSEEKDFHGNPIDEDGSLVVTEWGDELLDEIKRSSGLGTDVFLFGDRKLGLDAEFLEVFVSRKPGPGQAGQTNDLVEHRAL